MTSQQILESFSQTLMQDERILTHPERELLTTLLRHARSATKDPQLLPAVENGIYRALGETISQRVFTLVGRHVVEQIVAGKLSSSVGNLDSHSDAFLASLPIPPGPQPPSKPAEKPIPPPPGPQPPSIGVRRASDMARQSVAAAPFNESSVAVMTATQTRVPELVRAQCVILDEFLAPQEMDELFNFTLQQEKLFENSEVISPSGIPGVVDQSHRRSRVLSDLGRYEELVLQRVRGVLPQVLHELGIDDFAVTETEVQITASNDGDFFHRHCDDSQQKIASRRVTFVYFFHSEPAQFEGGNLVLHDAAKSGEIATATGNYKTIPPRQNQIVFFPCATLHEITPVRCQSKDFADSRFTVNGWLHH